MFLLLRILMIITFSAWIVLWFLKPTNGWTRKWKEFEDNMQRIIFKYNGMILWTLPSWSICLLIWFIDIDILDLYFFSFKFRCLICRCWFSGIYISDYWTCYAWTSIHKFAAQESKSKVNCHIFAEKTYMATPISCLSILVFLFALLFVILLPIMC